MYIHNCLYISIYNVPASHCNTYSSRDEHVWCTMNALRSLVVHWSYIHGAALGLKAQVPSNNLVLGTSIPEPVTKQSFRDEDPWEN